MGGMMGSMFAPNPIVGAAVGAGLGGAIGAIAGFHGSVETASERLQEFSHAMSSNLSGLNSYITAQKKAVSTTDMEEFKDALLSANDTVELWVRNKTNTQNYMLEIAVLAMLRIL